jgi:glycosyltransferase involved in cell wall biosynthesis
LDNHLHKSGNVLVSIIVCSRNEEKYIEECINSLTNQKNIPGKFEIIVVDGMSEDGTRDILSSLADKDEKIILMDNPAKVKPPAVNSGFKNSKGKFLAICDAHTVFADDYISILLQIMDEHSEAQCVGGPIVSIGDTNFGKANAIAMSSVIGVGNAKHRFPDYEGYAEMACFPLFRREVLEMIGYYDERFIINHDDEYCHRLRLAGGKVFLSHRAKSYYTVRSSPSKLFYQYYLYGFWQIATLKKHKIPISIRQLIPVTFYILIFILFVNGIIANNWIIALGLPVIYSAVLLLFAVKKLLKEAFSVAKFIPLALFFTHFSYAVGFIAGFIKFNFQKEKFDS